ncbi:MAG: R3H domain-containing nucleic acid-binding protein [Candidatus Margulisiibacteriota bacterium]|jgi:spoIIIJ-associated protein
MFWNKKAEVAEEQQNILKDRKDEAMVENAPLTQDDAEEAKAYLQEILNAMEYITSVVIRGVNKEENQINLEITGDEDLGKIIGKNGATLDALQYLSTIITSRKLKKRVRVIVDANMYRKRKEEKLVQEVTNSIQSVQATGKEISMEAMNPAERRQVHQMVAEHPDLVSLSAGEAPFRRVVISLKK